VGAEKEGSDIFMLAVGAIRWRVRFVSARNATLYNLGDGKVAHEAGVLDAVTRTSIVSGPG
jgi:hypothetical protein